MLLPEIYNSYQHLKITFNLFHPIFSTFFLFFYFFYFSSPLAHKSRFDPVTMIITIAINRFKATPRRLKSRLHRSLLTEQTSKRFHDGTSTPIDATMSRRLSPLTFFFSLSLFFLSLSISCHSERSIEKKKKKIPEVDGSGREIIVPGYFPN